MRPACLLLGLAVLALIWAGPLLAAYRDSFAAHMLAHMGVVAIAAPLLALALPPFAFRRKALPVLASLIELVVVWFWHAPSMRALVQAWSAAIVVEQVAFLAAGLFLWATCLGDGRKGGAGQGAAGAFGLLLTSVHMTLLGALLALAPRPLYGAADVTCFGVTLGAGQDQQIGGVVMLLVGAAVYLAGGVSLLERLLAEDRPGVPLARRPAR